MSRYSALPALTIAAVAAGLFAASPAMASDVQSFCPFQGVQFLPDGSQEFGVEANGAGCVVVNVSNSGVALSEIVVAPGWTDEVTKDEAKRVEVRFQATSTHDRVRVRVEPGKTEVK